MTCPAKVATVFAGFVLIASSAHAQATEEQVLHCAGLRTAAARVKCHDALAKSTPPAGLFLESVVEVRPELISGPALEYPHLLHQAGVQGRVLVLAILDTLGRAEPASVKVIESPDSGFDQVAREYVLHAIFRPARIHGRAVRVLINMPLDFKIRP